MLQLVGKSLKETDDCLYGKIPHSRIINYITHYDKKIEELFVGSIKKDKVRFALLCFENFVDCTCPSVCNTMTCDVQQCLLWPLTLQRSLKQQ